MEEASPSFYLGGQCYEFDSGILGGGADLVRQAIYETYRQAWCMWSDYHAGRVTVTQWRLLATEMWLGIFALRDLIPADRGFVPQNHFTIWH